MDEGLPEPLREKTDLALVISKRSFPGETAEATCLAALSFVMLQLGLSDRHRRIPVATDLALELKAVCVDGS